MAKSLCVMNLRDHLEKIPYFYEVAKLGTLSEASQKLGITQPSLSKSIKILEESIDRKLFTRMPRGMVLTQEGEVLLKYCHQLFSSLTDLEFNLQDAEDSMSGFLRVGTYDSIAIYYWPYLLRKFLLKYPKLRLELITDRSYEIQKMVEKNELDLGLIIDPKKSSHLDLLELGFDHFRFYESLYKEPIYKDRERAPIIYMPNSLVSEKEIEEILPVSKGKERIFYKTSSLESAKELALNGVGVALLPKKVAEGELKKKKFMEVFLKEVSKKEIGRHRIGIVYSKHRKNSKALIQLLNVLGQTEWSS